MKYVYVIKSNLDTYYLKDFIGIYTTKKEACKVVDNINDNLPEYCHPLTYIKKVPLNTLVVNANKLVK